MERRLEFETLIFHSFLESYKSKLVLLVSIITASQASSNFATCCETETDHNLLEMFNVILGTTELPAEVLVHDVFFSRSNY